MFRSIVAVGLALVGGGAAVAQEIPLDKITLPPGFSIAVYASGVPNARSWGHGAVADRHAVRQHASGRRRVRRRRPRPGPGGRRGDHDRERAQYAERRGDSRRGVVRRRGEPDPALPSTDDIEARLPNPPEPVVVYDELPSERMHGWKFIRFGPDGKLYVPVGAPCNICDRTGDDERFATITRMNPDADRGDHEVFAHGIRNSVGFDWHPVTGELWFTSNGGDRLGDEVPGDTLNHASEIGMHFGYPFCHQGDIPDPEFGTTGATSRTRSSARSAAAASSRRRRRPSDRTWRRSACGSTTGRCSPTRTGTRSSLPSMVRGTAAPPRVTPGIADYRRDARREPRD